jgi:hypothetical protein
MNGERAALRAPGLVDVDGQRVIAELMTRGANVERARALAYEGLRRAGGRDASYVQERQGLRAGMRTQPQRVTVFLKGWP